MKVPEHLYIHVPFCKSKCRYCAFYSETAEPYADYWDLVGRELELRGWNDVKWKTVYVGGGTPSLIENCKLKIVNCRDCEFTMECNPADITPEFASRFAASGITRVSVGVQSFDDATLRFLGRRHDSATARVAVSGLRHAGVKNISLDLIAAVPYSPGTASWYPDSPGTASWYPDKVPRSRLGESLKEAVALEPEHISVYPLSIETGTEFWRMGVKCLSDDETMDELAAAEDFLVSHGYERYEISNYCRKGYECRHNLAVWQGGDYAAAGPAAASRVGLERRVNAPDAAAWAAALRRGELPPGVVETLTPEEDERERFVTGLRLKNGVKPENGERVALCEKFVELGLMANVGGGVYTLTRRGREVADAVAGEF